MKRNVYLLVDETKNEIIGCEVSASNESMCLTLKQLNQQNKNEVKVSCYRIQQINVDDDNNVTFPASKNPDLILTPIWCSIDEKSVNEQQLKEIISEEEDNEHLQ